MADSSDEDEIIEQYHAVEPTIEAGKKSKSVDGGDRLTNLEGYEIDELSHIGPLSKSRKSQHEINHEDIKSLELMMQLQKAEMEMLESDILLQKQSSKATSKAKE